MTRLFALFVVGASLLGACGSGSGGADPQIGGSFIAFARDFQGFRSWTAFDLGDDRDDGVAVVGHRRAYINRLPDTGSTAFPVGTVIVKTIGEEQPVPGQVFAMAKRGGTYNAQGALGWEWFELTSDAATAPLIRWRGIVPPAGEIYAGVAGGACNTCHMVAPGAANDFVPSDELLLSNF